MSDEDYFKALREKINHIQKELDDSRQHHQESHLQIAEVELERANILNLLNEAKKNHSKEVFNFQNQILTMQQEFARGGTIVIEKPVLHDP